MRRDHLERAAGRHDFAADRAARLALPIGNVMDLRISDWPPAYERLSVFAVDCRDGLGAHAVGTERCLQSLERIAGAGGARTPRIDFLQRYDVWLVRLDQFDHASQIETAVPAMGAVNFPGHHADRRRLRGSHNGSSR